MSQITSWDEFPTVEYVKGVYRQTVSGEKVMMTRIVYRDGVPIAVVEGGILREVAPMDVETATEVSRTLKLRSVPRELPDPAFVHGPRSACTAAPNSASSKGFSTK